MCTRLYRGFATLLLLVLVSACSSNILAGAPLGAALASCSIPANATRMVPEIPTSPSHEMRYPVHVVQVVGPIKSSVPPPILAKTFTIALESTLQKANLLHPHEQTNHYILIANIDSQKRQGSFSRTSLELTVKYAIREQDNPEQSVWETDITTAGELKDWKTDACQRLRNLQEDLSKQNIRQLLSVLPMKQ